MMRRLLARSTVIAALAAILVVLWHAYGIERLGIGTTPIPFPATDDSVKISGQFRAGPRSGEYRRVDFVDADLRALNFSAWAHDIYVGNANVERGIVITRNQQLLFFAQKNRFAGHEAEPYEIRLSRVQIADAGRLAPTGEATLFRGVWTKETEQASVWTLQVKGVPGKNGRANILVPGQLPVITKIDQPFDTPIVISGGSNEPVKACLD